MQAGAIHHVWERLELKVALAATLSRTGTGPPGVIAGGGLVSYTCPSSVSKIVGISLGCETKEDYFSTTGSSVSLTITELLYSDAVTGVVWDDSLEAELIFEDVILYQSSGGWLLTFSAWSWSANATPVYSDDNGGLGFTLTGPLTPAGIPLIGIPPRLGASAATTSVPAEVTDCATTEINGSLDSTLSTVYTTYTKDVTVTATATGGWRVMIDGDYYAFPVTLDIAENPSSACSPLSAEPTATTTYDGVCTAYAKFHDSFQMLAPNWECDSCTSVGLELGVPIRYDIYRDRTEYDTYANSVMLLPDHPKGVERLADSDYAALILRGGLPAADREARAVCCYHYKARICDADSATNTDTANLDTPHPGGPSALVRVTNDTHDIEAPFALPTYTPYSITGTRNHLYSLLLHIRNPGACGGGSDPHERTSFDETGLPDCCFPQPMYREFATITHAYPQNVTTPADAFEYLEHTDSEAEFINFVAHPHWSYVYYFPPNADLDYWWADGAKVNSDVYWTAIREQWFDAADISVGDNVRTRNNLISPPLAMNFPGSNIEGIVGTGAVSAWWGVCRHLSDLVVPDASQSLTSASSSLWSASSATLTHGANITVNPSALSCSVSLDLGSFSNELRMYPHLCDRIAVSWSGASIDSVSVVLVTPDGSEVEIATATGTHSRITGPEAKFAGSWAQDFGVGVITDTGADTDAAGVSATVCADPERIVAFLLVNGWTAGTLRFDFTLNDHSVDFTVTYPTFYVPSANASILQETGQVADILFPSGPGLRYGQWKAFDEAGAATLMDPVIRDPGSTMTLVDWLVWKRLVLQGIAKDSGLQTEIESLYDEVELGTWATADEVYAAAALYTHTFLINGGKAGNALIVNGQSEVPPLAVFPMYERDADQALTPGTFEQKSYSHATETRYIVSGGAYIHMDDNSPRTQWTSVSSFTLAGWFITEHRHIVDNDEGDGFILYSPDGDIATASPWHGYFTAGFTSDNAASWISQCRDYTDRLFVFLRDSNGNLCALAYDSDDLTYVVYKVDTDTDCTHPSYYLFGDTLMGTHLRTNTAILAQSFYHGITDTNGRAWTLVTIDNAITYTALTSCDYIDRLVVLGYHQNAGGGDTDATNWYVQVGEMGAAGTYTWSNPVEITTLTSPSNYGNLRCRELDGALEFVYLDTGGVSYIAHCFSLDLSGVGDWV